MLKSQSTLDISDLRIVEALLVVQKKPPVIDGRIPRQDERYNLDDYSVRKNLGLDPNANLAIVDEYDHYPDCKWAIIEYKSRSLRDGVPQLVSTAKQLWQAENPVNFVIIVAEKINRAERKLFGKRGNILYNKLKKSPTPIKIWVGNDHIDVNIYKPEEIEKQYQKYKGSLERWVSK